MKRLPWIFLLAIAGCAAEHKPAVQTQPGAGLAGTNGLMNFRQLRSAFSVGTGISPYEEGVFTAFESLKDRLPATNAADQLAQPVVTASVGLGAAFCHALVEKETRLTPRKRRFFAELSLGQAPEDFALKAAAKELTSSLWRRQATDAEAEELVALGRDIYAIGIKKTGATTVTAGQETWLALCTAAGSAVDSLTL